MMEKIKFKAAYDKEAETMTADLAIDIMADDGRPLFTIKQLECGGIEVATPGSVARHAGVMLDSGLSVIPRASNVVVIKRIKYDKDKS